MSITNYSTATTPLLIDDELQTNIRLCNSYSKPLSTAAGQNFEEQLMTQIKTMAKEIVETNTYKFKGSFVEFVIRQVEIKNLKSTVRSSAMPIKRSKLRQMEDYLGKALGQNEQDCKRRWGKGVTPSHHAKVYRQFINDALADYGLHSEGAEAFSADSSLAAFLDRRNAVREVLNPNTKSVAKSGTTTARQSFEEQLLIRIKTMAQEIETNTYAFRHSFAEFLILGVELSNVAHIVSRAEWTVRILFRLSKATFGIGHECHVHWGMTPNDHIFVYRHLINDALVEHGLCRSFCVSNGADDALASICHSYYGKR